MAKQKKNNENVTPRTPKSRVTVVVLYRKILCIPDLQFITSRCECDFWCGGCIHDLHDRNEFSGHHDRAGRLSIGNG